MRGLWMTRSDETDKTRRLGARFLSDVAPWGVCFARSDMRCPHLHEETSSVMRDRVSLFASG
jgi:hypothetical protein